MRAEEIREMSEQDIRDRVSELEEERFRLRFRAATETLEEPLRLRVIRREVARMKTILRERETGRPVLARTEASSKPAARKSGRASRARGGKKS